MSAPDPRLRRAIDNAKILAAELARARSDRPDTTELIPAAPGAVPTQPLPAGPESTAPTSEQRPRAAVVTWDLAHNPAGRALVLHDLLARTHDTTLMGPMWSEHGNQVWRPIRQHIGRPETFPAHDFGDFFAHSFAMAARSRVDTVHIGKPRLPALVLGAMVQRTNGASLVLDIDDEETAFFDEVDSADRFADPTGGEATRWAHHQIAGVAVHTVSNVELRKRYGGIMVRHARDERQFDPSVADRSAGRARLGASDTDFVVLFVGTPRPHKGLDQVVQAMAHLDDRFVLHVVGATDPQAAATELARPGVTVRAHPPCDFDTLPDLLAGADALALLQDPADPIARFQIPAKISDGLALAKPVFVAATPPLADLAEVGITVVAGPDSLATALRQAADEQDPAAAANRRQGFLSEFSHAVNGARIIAAHTQAATHDATSWSETVIDEARAGYEIDRRRRRPDLFEVPDATSDGALDVAFFWKQNDSDIYGRRADMIAQAMATSPRFGRVMHFDAPVDVRMMAGELDRPPAELPEETTWVHQNIVDRHLRLIDQPTLIKRVFVYSDAGDHDPLTGMPFPTSDGYPAFVAAELEAAGLDPATTLAWVCPIAPGFDAVAEAVGFGSLVVDIIDDQRVLHPRRSDSTRIDDAYAELIPDARSVFTNCEPNVAAFADHAATIHVVPNGAEVERLARAVADRVSTDRRRVVYVGDMRSRIDWVLVEEVVDLLDDHSFVFAGSTDGRSEAVTRLAARPNVEFRGVVPYARVPDLLAEADVAIVPHLQGPMTERMNPLKVYNYLAAGLPVVATVVENLEDLAGHVTVTSGAKQFAEAVAAAHVDPDLDPTAVLASIDWSARLADIIEHLDADGVFELVQKESRS